MGSCNSTENDVQTSLERKSSSKSSKKLFQSKKLRNLKESLENKFSKTLTSNELALENKVVSHRRNSLGEDEEEEEEANLGANNASFDAEDYASSSLITFSNFSKNNKRFSQNSFEHFLLIDDGDTEANNIEISMSLNQVTNSAVQTLNVGLSSIPTSVNNQQRTNAPLSRFGFKPASITVPLSSFSQVQTLTKQTQNLSQVLFNDRGPFNEYMTSNRSLFD